MKYFGKTQRLALSNVVLFLLVFYANIAQANSGASLDITFSEDGSAIGTITFPEKSGESLYTKLEVRENSAKNTYMGESKHLFGSLRDPNSISTTEIVVGVQADRIHDVSIMLETTKSVPNGEVRYKLDLKLPQKEEISLVGLLNGFVPITTVILNEKNIDESFSVELGFTGEISSNKEIDKFIVVPSGDNALEITLKPIKYSIITLGSRIGAISLILMVGWGLCYFLVEGSTGGKINIKLVRLFFTSLTIFFALLSYQRFSNLGQYAFIEFEGMLYVSGVLLFFAAAIAGKQFATLTKKIIKLLNSVKTFAFGLSIENDTNAK